MNNYIGLVRDNFDHHVMQFFQIRLQLLQATPVGDFDRGRPYKEIVRFTYEGIMNF